MKKTVILFIFVFIFNTVYAKNYNAYDIEKQTGVEFAYCCGENSVIEYDYAGLNDDEKLDDALLYYFKLFDISTSMNDDGSPECIVYFSGFQNYILESLGSIEDTNIKNSKKYHYANIIYNISKNGLYEYDKIMDHINQLGNISLKDITSFFKGNLSETDYTLLERTYKAIEFLSKNADIKGDLKAAVFYEKILNENLTNEFMFDPDQHIGYNSQARKVDIFNSKTDIYSSTDVQGSGMYVDLLAYLGDIDDNILAKYVASTGKSYNIPVNDTYGSRLESVTYSCFSLSQDKIYIFPFMERVYVIKTYPLSSKLYDMLLFTLDNLSKNCDDHIFISNIKGRVKTNPRFSSIDSSKAANLKQISEEEVFKNTEKSPFIKDKEALLSKETDYTAYSMAQDEYFQSFTDYICEYLNGMPGQPYLVPSEFYKFDIDNDGKDELLGVIEVVSSTVGDTGKYTIILNEKTLEIENHELNNFLITFMGSEYLIADEAYQNLFPNDKIKNKLSEIDIGNGLVQNFYQKLYTKNGKNKIALIDDSAYGIYIDILDKKGKLEVNTDTVYLYKSKPKIVWHGDVKNGRAEDLLNTNASFDMSKASTLSEKEIVNDVNLRMLDRLSSDKYFKSIKNVGNEEKNRLLNERRMMNKDIKNCNGDNKCIKDILYSDVFR